MSLLAWWKLNGDLLDSSGNEKHGTLFYFKRWYTLCQRYKRWIVGG